MREYTFEEIEIGLVESFQKKVTDEDEDMFRKITGDLNPLHMDDSFAKMKWGVFIGSILLLACLQPLFILHLLVCTFQENIA